MNKRLCLIVNPHSGGGRAGRIAGRAEELLGGHGFQVRAQQLSDRAGIAAAAAHAATAGEVVAVIGGDGIVSAAAEGLKGTATIACLGIIPAGRGNDLARALGIPRQLKSACKLIASGQLQRLDLGEVDGRVFVGIASVGFDSEANRIANAAPGWLGRFSYVYGAIRALLVWRCAHFTVRQVPLVQEELHAGPPATACMSFEGFSIGLANSPYFGGGMRLAPMARLDDGMLDLVAITKMSKLMFAIRSPLVFAGRHIGLDVVRAHKCQAVRIEADRPMVIYADGDPIAPLPVEVRVLPSALAVFTPQTLSTQQAQALQQVPCSVAGMQVPLAEPEQQSAIVSDRDA